MKLVALPVHPGGIDTMCRLIVCVLVEPGLDLCVGVDVLGFVAAPDVNTARMGWYGGSVFVHW